ncbi:MAG TPA: response regulator transcription factor [Chloroflexota bacterium]|jgi:DNA-binding response OmpR family regulator
MHERILVVDDEPIVTEVVERYLVREGYRVTVVRDGRAAIQAAAREAPDLIVLDLMLPGVDGLEVCRTIRAESKVPIIILSAKDEESDKILGLGLGADDYLAKPFSPRELVARVQAVLRRTRSAPPEPGDQLRYESLRINPKARAVELADRVVDLTAKEFDLLYFLARHPGQVFSREQLLDQVWDYHFVGDASTVTVHVRRLREKIEADPVRPRYVKTVWGVGYKFDPGQC